MKKLLIIIPIVIVVAAATVLGLFAAGVFGKKVDEPVAHAVEASAGDLGVFKGFGTDAYFDIRADRDPSTSLDNFVIIRDNKGNKVPLKSTRQGEGVYRITSRDGLMPRASHQIWATGATFADEKYKGLDTFIFMTKGDEVENVTVNPAIKKTTVEGTVVEKVLSGSDIFYNIILPTAAEERYQKGDLLFAKKPASSELSEEFLPLYAGDIPGYEYNGLAAYCVERTSEVKNGKEEVYCRLASINEVFTQLDINKTLPITEENFSVNEELLQEALEKSDFTAAVYEAAVEAFDLLSGSFEKTVKDSPKMVAKFEYDVNTDKIQLNFYFTITLAKGMDVVFAVKNTIYITPNVNCDLDVGVSDFDLQLDLGVNLKTTTVCTIEMDTTDAKLQAKDIDDFKTKFKDLVSGKTAEKGIVGTELPIYSYKYPIYCFVLGIEFGVDINLGIKAQIAFEYDYNTDITVGVTYVNGEINTYKSIDTSSSAKDLVLLGKLKAEAGVYVKLTASLLEVAGVGLKVGTGVYAEIGGQIRLDMQAALENKELHIIKGYYVTGGLYLDLSFQLKAGITLPVIGWKGYEKSFDLFRYEYPLFEFGSKYLVQGFVNSDMAVELQGKNQAFDKVKVNAFDLDKVADANAIEIGIDAFDITYLDDAASYITIKDGIVTVNPTIGTEFSAKVQLTAKSDNYVKGTVTFHKAAVMPTCEQTTASFDKLNPADVTFDVKKNQSTFITFTGEGITENYIEVDSDGAVTLSKNFLSGLAVGDHVFSYVTDKGRVALTVSVIDTTPISSKNNKTLGTFLKSDRANVVFNLLLSGSKVTEVEGLKKGDYSVDSAGTLVVYANYLMTLAPDTYEYTIKASNGSTLDIAVVVRDDRLPEVLTTSFTFGKNAGVKADVTVPFVSYGYTLTTVSGSGIAKSNYIVSDGSLAIRKEFLAAKSAGNYAFVLTFDDGVESWNRNISVNVVDNATVIAAVASATFDLNDPKDAEFKVLTTADRITVSGNGLAQSSYTVSETTVKFYAGYMKTLSVGTYNYTVTAAGATAQLTLSVIDTTEPVIESAVGGVMTIEYDKAKSGDRFFEMILAGKAFDKVDGNGITEDAYTVGVDSAKGTTKVTLKSSYLDSLRVGTHEYSVLTSVNVSTLVINVVDTRTPETSSETSLSYTLGSDQTRTVIFNNYEHGIKSISVKGGEALSLYSDDCTFDAQTGVFTLNASYLEALPVNTYVTVFITFDDAASTSLTITLAVTK